MLGKKNPHKVPEGTLGEGSHGVGLSQEILLPVDARKIPPLVEEVLGIDGCPWKGSWFSLGIGM